MNALNWKARSANRHEALASRVVGGKYFIEWREGYYSDQRCEWVQLRCFDIRYQTKGGGGYSNISRTHNLRTVAQAKAIAELDHAKRKTLIEKYGDTRAVPYEAWSQFNSEMFEAEEKGNLS